MYTIEIDAANEKETGAAMQGLHAAIEDHYTGRTASAKALQLLERMDPDARFFVSVYLKTRDLLNLY